MIKFARLSLLFLSLNLVSSINDHGTCFYALPDETFTKVIGYLVPNFLSPTHPEEIREQSKQLSKFKICKEFEGRLDKFFNNYINFWNMENLFVTRYHWPFDKFTEAYTIILNQGYQQDRKRLIQYSHCCTLLRNQSILLDQSTIETNLACELIRKCCYGPFSVLLKNGKFKIWQAFVEWANTIKDSEESVFDMRLAFARQYLQYPTLENIEGSCPFSESELENARKSLEQDLLNCFHYKNCKVVLSEKTIIAFSKYVQNGGFLTRGMYRQLWQLLNNNKAMSDPNCSATVKEIGTVFDLNMLLAYVLSDSLEVLKHNRIIISLEDFFPNAPIDFFTFLNTFNSCCWIFKKNYTDTDMHVIDAFFENYKAYFNRYDSKGRLFLYCLSCANKGEMTLEILFHKSFARATGAHEDSLKAHRDTIGKKYLPDKHLLSTVHKKILMDFLAPHGSASCVSVNCRQFDREQRFCCVLFTLLLCMAIFIPLGSLLHSHGTPGHPFGENMTIANFTPI